MDFSQPDNKKQNVQNSKKQGGCTSTTLSRTTLDDTIPAQLGQVSLTFGDTEALEEEQADQYQDSKGQLKIKKLFKDFPRLQLVYELAKQHKFFHWELNFADVFASRGGFDLILGNPPWKKVEWKELDVLGDFDPIVVVKPSKFYDISKLRSDILGNKSQAKRYYDELVQAHGSRIFLNAITNYHKLGGAKANLYKCFIPKSWEILNTTGIAGLLHPENTYEDPDGKEFRSEIYKKLIFHFQFQNEKKLFPIHHSNKFSINIYKQNQVNVNFLTISNLFVPGTINESFESKSSQMAVPGLKDEEGNWSVLGHRERIVKVGYEELRLFAILFDSEGTFPTEARLPAIHANSILEVLKKFALLKYKLSFYKSEWFSTGMWNETYSKKDGLLIEETGFPSSQNDLVYSGPHFYVGNPVFKTPQSICDLNSSYDFLYLDTINENYIPRTKFRPSSNREWYEERIPRVNFSNIPIKVTDFYRFINREMVGTISDRTLISTIIPKGSSHLKSCVSIAFSSTDLLLSFSGMTFSIVNDFFVKSTGLSHVNISLLNQLPLIPPDSQQDILIKLRTLQLCSVTNSFKELWEENWKDEFKQETWAKDDPRLNIISSLDTNKAQNNKKGGGGDFK